MTKSAPGSHELLVDYFEIISPALAGIYSFTNQIGKDASPSLKLDKRHLMIRDESVSKVLKLRSHVMKAFRDYLHTKCITEVNPPLLVQV